MNKPVNPYLAFALIALFGALFSLQFYLHQHAVEVPKLSHIKSSPTGNVHILLGDNIYNYTSSGELNNVLDLSTLQIKDHFGDFAFFSNGDLLINRDTFLPTTTDKVNTFLRKENRDQTLVSNGVGLQRCDLSRLSCKQFTTEIPSLQGAFHLFINPKTDDVYLADTSRHAIRKLNQEGDLLAELTSDLYFPNQVWLNKSKLWIVDTNNHVMKAVQADTDRFGHLIEQHTTTTAQPWVWPSAFSKVEGKWWVTISDNAMENAKVLIFNSLWGERDQLDLGDDADPISSLVIDHKVIITDGAQFKLHQFDFKRNQLEDFAIHDTHSQGIHPALQKNKAIVKKYTQWSNYCLWFTISLFVIIFILAILHARKGNAQKSQADKPESINSTSLPVNGEWLECTARFKLIQRLGTTIFSILLLLTAIVLYSLGTDLTLELVSPMLIIPFIFLIILPVKKLSALKIGFFHDKITIEAPNGQSISSPYHDIKWHKRAFIVDDWVIPIGNPAQSIFPYERLIELLMPRMLDSMKMTELELIRYQWRSPEHNLKGITLAVLIGSIMMMMHERKWILEFLASLGF